VSKNGCLLLNIGPRADGSIPEPEQAILREIGGWLAANGEAIYGTRPWTLFGEGPTEVTEGAFTDTQRSAFTAQDLRFTTQGETLYAIAMAWPEDGQLTIGALAEGAEHYPGAIGAVERVSTGAPLAWTRTAEGLRVDLSGQPPEEHAVAIRVRPA